MKEIDSKKSYFARHWRTLVLSAVVFLLLATAAAGPLIYKAYGEMTAAQEQALQQKNAAINQAILNKDYTTWSSLVTDSNLKKQISAGNFSTFADAYRLLEQGKLQEADILQKQLSLKEDFKATVAKSALISDAIANKDYTAWREVVGANEATTVTATNFDSYANILSSIEQGKLNAAAKAQYSLGLKQGATDYTSSHD